jgi:TolA-binding protein
MFYFNTLKDYNAAVAIFRDDSATPDASDLDYKMLAHSYERKGQLDKALATWEIIQQRWPKSPALVVNMNRVRAKLAAAGSKSSGQ